MSSCSMEPSEPLDVQFETHVDTAITVPNFTERYYASQNGALDRSEREFASKHIPYASMEPWKGRLGKLGYIRAYVKLEDEVRQKLRCCFAFLIVTIRHPSQATNRSLVAQPIWHSKLDGQPMTSWFLETDDKW